jgi:hypothetical protein
LMFCLKASREISTSFLHLFPTYCKAKPLFFTALKHASLSFCIKALKMNKNY